MRLSRRRVLALAPTLVAGCGERIDDGRTGEEGGNGTGSDGEGDGARRTAAPSRDRTASRQSTSPQEITVENAHGTTEFVTVAVESEEGTVFVESRELVPGERHTARDVLAMPGSYDVIVETAAGNRATYCWEVVDGLDGLAVTLAEGIEFVRTVRCGPDCAVADAGESVDVPLVGDGSARWYAPARVVLTNPGAATDAALTVSLDGRTVVDYRYRVARETRVVVPLTYRSGTYRVIVETPAGRTTGDWRVPEEPSRVVDVSTLDVGCGPANTTLRLENADDRPHAVGLRVEHDGTVRFVGEYRLAPDERRTVVPVVESGRYDVSLRVDGGREETWAWWSCPPHGPATVLVDATGTATFGQAGL
jgi:hypothetical protein